MCSMYICIMWYMNGFELPWFLNMNCGYWKAWLNGLWKILMSILTPYEWWIHKGFLYVSHNLKRFKKRKELMACYPSICLFETKRNWLPKRLYDFKMKRDGPTCSTEKTVVATSMIPISLKV